MLGFLGSFIFVHTYASRVPKNLGLSQRLTYLLPVRVHEKGDRKSMRCLLDDIQVTLVLWRLPTGTDDTQAPVSSDVEEELPEGHHLFKLMFCPALSRKPTKRHPINIVFAHPAEVEVIQVALD